MGGIWFVAEGIKGRYLALFSLDLQHEKLYNVINNNNSSEGGQNENPKLNF